MRRALRTRVGRLAVPAVVALSVVTGAWGYWTTTGTGSASGSVGTLAAPTISSATPGAGTVALSWTAVTPPGSGTVSYYVTRDGGEPGGSCSSSSSPSTVTSCTDSGVSVSTHEYTVTAVWHMWTVTSTAKSAQVTFGPATHLLLKAATTTPTAGVADNLTITAQDAANNTVATYAGSHNLTFGGAATIGSFNPTVTSSAGAATNFGTATAIVFTNGVATVSGANNGAMKLYKAETASVTVSDGAVNNGAGLSVTVGSAAAASFSLAAATTTPAAGAADNLTITAYDAFGNVATTYTGSKNLTFGGAATVGAFKPTVTKSTGAATNFGTATAIVFTSGVATVSGTSNGVMTLYKAETASVTVSAGALNNGAGLSVTVSEGPAASLSLAAATTTPTAGAADNLTITAQDAYGNTVPTYTGSHNLTFGGAATIGSFTPTVTSSAGAATNFGTATAITFTNGVASVSGASNGVMTLYKVEAAKITVSDGSLNNGTGPSVTVSPATAASLSPVAATTTPTAGVADNLTITAKDAYGNTATAYTGSHNLTFGGAATIGSFNPTVTSSAGAVTNFGTATAITFTNGVATVSGANNGAMKLYKAETASITVSDGAVNNGAGLSVTAGSAAAASFSMAAATTTPTAGAADNLTITALDAFGNTATTYTGSKSLTFGGAATIGAFKPTVTSSAGTVTNFGTATAITFTNGVASVASGNNGAMKLYKAETASITVSAGTLNNGAGLSVTVGEGPAASLSPAATTATPVAGVADNLTITALDAFGNTVPTYTGSHNLTFGGAATIGSFIPTVTSSAGAATNFGTATAITFTNGVASVSGASNGVMTLYKVEAAKITVSDGTLNNGAGLSVTVGEGPVASLSLAAATTTPTAGVADNLTITAKDAYGNTATAYTGSHNLTFGGAATIGSFTPTVTSSSGTVTNFGTTTAITFTNGVATISGANNGVMKLYKVETANVTVSDGAINNGAGLSVTVGSAAVASLSLAAATTTPTAGAADNLTITAQDTYGNSYSGSQNLTFGGAATIGAFKPTVTSSSGTATNFGTATAITFTNGVATVSGANNGAMKLYKVETTSITVSDGAINNGAGLSVTVGVAPAASLSPAATTATPVAGAADNLTITAKDAYGNTATTYAGSQSLTFGGASNGPNGDPPTVTSSSGTVTNFGTATAITFTNGVATVSGANNGAMKLYKVEAASITVSDGAINNGAGLSVTPKAGAAARLAWTHVVVSSGTLSSPCLFTCTVTALGNSGTFTANVSVTDSAGNTVTSLGAGHTVSVTNVGGSISGGSLTISSAGAADSTTQLTFTAQNGSWTSDSLTAQTSGGTSYTSATATVTQN